LDNKVIDIIDARL